eukprot:s989_g13.t1
MEATSPVQDAEGEALEVIKQQLEDLRSQNQGQAAALRDLQEGVGKFVRLDDRPIVLEGQSTICKSWLALQMEMNSSEEFCSDVLTLWRDAPLEAVAEGR